MDDTSLPSKADEVASVISKVGSMTTSSVVKTISYRISVSDLARIDAMASEAGKSRNAMLNLVLDVGLEAVQRKLPPKVAKSVGKREVQAIKSLLTESIDTVSE